MCEEHVYTVNLNRNTYKTREESTMTDERKALPGPVDGTETGFVMTSRLPARNSGSQERGLVLRDRSHVDIPPSEPPPPSGGQPPPRDPERDPGGDRPDFRTGRLTRGQLNVWEKIGWVILIISVFVGSALGWESGLSMALILIATAGICFGLWYLTGITVQAIARKKKFFVLGIPNSFVVIMKGGEVVGFIVWSDYVHLESLRGDFIPGGTPRSLLNRLFGVDWIGLYPVYRLLEWDFAWERPDRDGVVQKKDRITHHFIQALYGHKRSGLEDSDGFGMEWLLGLPLRTINPYKTIFVRSPNPGEKWFQSAMTVIDAVVRDFGGAANKTYDKHVEDKKTGTTEFTQALMKANEYGLADVGQQLEGAFLIDIILEESVRKATQAAGVARLQADAEVEAARGVRARGQAEADVIKAKELAEVAGVRDELDARVTAIRSTSVIPGGLDVLTAAAVGGRNGLAGTWVQGGSQRPVGVTVGVPPKDPPPPPPASTPPQSTPSTNLGGDPPASHNKQRDRRQGRGNKPKQ